MFKQILKRLTAININNAAIVIAYYALLAIFPTIILIGNLLPLLNVKAATILTYLENAVPKTIYHTLSPIILSFLDHGSGGLISISALVALWAVSRGINSLKLAFNTAYGVENIQNVLMTRLFSIVITFLLLASLAIIIILFSFGQLVLDYLTPILNISENLTGLFIQVKWPVTVLGLLFILGAMYFFLPNAKVHFWLIIPGTILATISWILLAQGFSIYVRYFARSVLSYGTLGTFIVLLFWLNYSGWVVMLGAVLNATLEEVVYHQIIPRKNRFKRYLIKKIKEK
ncbi:MAG: YihY/virulence factor BrkB family protein [Liquorilactobacillus nagelii]|uniref:YihY/virulence factor BrkB family protein n=1 Tax=Liquorilactobacillus nagelii TaxID=82688 RepID=UPI0006EF10A7|nr:YihY/virulence factor BrkB family protein [Liquorilactobacillus nagelii]KRL42345.1 ribonuclease BN [Liquorilactobacillus nagelii DSM 13675]MCI1634301.1 YihY/virulence factor BrkB family protein [Liquorilactobacillus nagelii]MCI1700428.1 YihY/virulence factor BrkB family protein [Liquorilactobacillus nagelii]MCI1922299.1 YihY/virulence factor BrkB family protein [Liquorilactobacillus nagelii]MCI1977477.1 YihY/virulence factor BrkB family protein [Liquorilactobacillus nagelii]